jgi:hypothetical protein
MVWIKDFILQPCLEDIPRLPWPDVITAAKQPSVRQWWMRRCASRGNGHVLGMLELLSETRH